MKGVIWLRVSAIVSLLFAGGHTLGSRSSWSPVGDNEVLMSMRTVHFNLQGVSRSFLDFYRGFGYSLSVFLVLQGVVLWQLAAVARKQPPCRPAARRLVCNRIRYRSSHHLDVHLSNSGDVFDSVDRVPCDRVRHAALIEVRIALGHASSAVH